MAGIRRPASYPRMARSVPRPLDFRCQNHGLPRCKVDCVSHQGSYPLLPVLCAHEAVSLDSAQQKVPACFHNCSGNNSYGRSSSMAVFITFPVLTRVAGTRAGPMPRVKYGSGVRTGPASRLVGWANIQPAAAPAPGHGRTGDILAGIRALILTSVKCHRCSSRRGVF